MFRTSRALARALLTALAVCAALTARGSAQTAFRRYTASAAKKKLPIYCVETAEKKVAITFDAAWGAEDTDDLLRILNAYDARATFFMCGYWVARHPEEARRIRDAGHDIANHGDTHAHVAQLNHARNLREVTGAHGKARQILGVEMNLYRPPYGEYNDTVLDAAKAAGYYVIQWDVDSHDWMNKGVAYEVNQVLSHRRLGPGSILLFHNGARDTPAALPLILDELRGRGYAFVPVSELIYKQDYYLDHEGRQRPNP